MTISLTGRIGIVIAAKGRQLGGEFLVEDVYYPDFAPLPERQIPDEDQYVALVSGLRTCDDVSTGELSLLMDFLTGTIGAVEVRSLA